MWLLLGTTITASFFDSLNPSAIAQQMLLQAMVKQKRHTLYFILGIGTANLAMGLAVYYGIAAWASVLLEKLVGAYPQHMYGRGGGRRIALSGGRNPAGRENGAQYEAAAPKTRRKRPSGSRRLRCSGWAPFSAAWN